MGVVEAVGADVSHTAPGDRAVVPFNISCGRCFMCDRRLFAQCETTQVREHRKGAALFGYTMLYGAVPAAQAECLRGGAADPLRMGQAHVKRWVGDLLPLVTRDAEDLATHHLPLERAPTAYEMFQKKQDGCIKVLLQP